MSAQHTPGPWELHADDMGGISPFVYPVHQEFPVAIVTGYYAGLKQRLPDARLIAAAPELLDATRLLLNWADAICNDGGSGEVKAARAAIAKATGSAE